MQCGSGGAPVAKASWVHFEPEIVSDGDNDFGYVFVLSNKYKSPDVLQLPPPRDSYTL